MPNKNAYSDSGHDPTQDREIVYWNAINNTAGYLMISFIHPALLRPVRRGLASAEVGLSRGTDEGRQRRRIPNLAGTEQGWWPVLFEVNARPHFD